MGILDSAAVRVARDTSQQPAPGAKMYVYRDGTDTLADLYSEPQLLPMASRSNPIVANNTGRFDTFYVRDGTFRILQTDPRGNVLYEESGLHVATPIQQETKREFATVQDMLADETMSYAVAQGVFTVFPGDYVKLAAQNFTYLVLDENDPGAHLTTQGGIKLSVQVGEHSRFNADAFNVDRTGATNTTEQLKLFYQACIDQTKDGILPAGTYLITLGELVFDNAHVETSLPYFHTAGYHSTKFLAADNSNAPFIAFTNGTASGPAGRYWMSGGHGGLHFERPASVGTTPQPNQHGILLRGLQGAKFDGFLGSTLSGSVVCIERALYQGYNPDPYHVVVTIDYVEAVRCAGYAFYNDNYVGFSGSTIEKIRAIECGGVYWGIGAGNKVGTISAGSCQGWAIGDPLDALGGASSRFKLEIAEIDDCEFGLQCGRLSTADFGAVRFVHRFEFSVPNRGSGLYWPVCAMSFGARSTNNVAVSVTHRVEAGGTKAQLGDFADFTNSGGNITDLLIRAELLDNAGLGIEAADLLTDYNRNSRVQYYLKGQAPILDNVNSVAALVRASSSTEILNGGFSPTQTVIWPTVMHDPSGLYDTTTGLYTCPYDGMYRVQSSFILTPNAVGERVRLGVAADGALIAGRYHYATTTNPSEFSIEFTVFGYRGQEIGVVADQNSGSNKTIASLISLNENFLAISHVK